MTTSNDPKADSFYAATITLSDKAARGEREDRSGALLRELLKELGLTLLPHQVLPDEQDRLSETLKDLARSADLILTTGGTGISVRDVTPEATAAILDKRLPGVEAALHQAGRDKVPTSILSRAVAGVRGRCLVVNLPGSPGGVRDGMQVLAPILHHALRVLRAEVRDCQEDLGNR